MYELYWTNQNYLADQVFETLDEAIEYGRSKGFEFSVFLDGDMVGFASGVSLAWNPQTMLSADEAVDRLMHMSRQSLFDICHDAHKDQYGMRGQHFGSYSKAELVNWYISHYKWDEKDQYWDSKIPFDNDDDSLYETKEDEYNYYRQFG